MLPSFRLIILTFVLSFVVVSGALRLIAPPRTEAFAQASPIETAPLERGGVGAMEWRQPEATVPVIFDLRFTPSEPIAVPASLTLYAIDRAARTAPEPQAIPEPQPAEAPVPELVANPAQGLPASTLSVPAVDERPLARNAPVQISPPTMPAVIPASAISSPLSMLPQESMPALLPPLSTTGAAPASSRSAPAADIAPVVTPPTAIAALPEANDPLPESYTMDEEDDATASVPSADTPTAVMDAAAEPLLALPLARPQLRSTAQAKRALKPAAKNSKRQAKTATARKPVAQRVTRVVRARASRATPAPRVAPPAAATTPPRTNGNPFATLFGSGAQ